MAIRYWLGVVHLDHVRIGVRQGIAQFNHGARGALTPMREADGIVYYSPRVSSPDGEPLREFTAIGRVAGGEPYQERSSGPSADGFRPWRRRIDFDTDAVPVPLRALTGMLEFTAAPNWGYQLRRGVIEISRHDFELIRRHMQRHPLPER